MKFRVQLSDRQRIKTVDAERGDEAASMVVGKRGYGLPNIESWTANGKSGTYNVMIQTGRTFQGCTPVKTIQAWVDTVD